MFFNRTFLALPIIVLVSWVRPELPVRQAESLQYECEELEHSTLQLINRHRASMIPKRTQLTLDDVIIQEARRHSQEMADGTVAVGHDGFDDRCAVIERVLPFRAAGENVATNYGYSDPASTAVMGWLRSPGHRANIERDYTLTGIGVARSAKGEYFFTQIFVKMR